MKQIPHQIRKKFSLKTDRNHFTRRKNNDVDCGSIEWLQIHC